TWSQSPASRWPRSCGSTTRTSRSCRTSSPPGRATCPGRRGNAQPWGGAAARPTAGTWVRSRGRCGGFLGRPPRGAPGRGGRPTIKHERCGLREWADIRTDTEGFYGAIDWDAGLAPLYPGSVFNRSKSYIKALEYAARGIPVVASDAEPYRGFVLHGVTGFLVKYDHEWLKYLEELTDPQVRADMGDKAREHAGGYTIEGTWQLWAAAYGGL